MLLYHNGNNCRTVQGTREESTNCDECLHKNLPIEQCTDKLLSQKINENVRRLNELFTIKRKHND